MSANTPVGTTLAILERTLKVMSAVQARVHYAFKQELQLLRDIIRDYTPDEYAYEPEEGGRFAKKSDYDNVDIIPVSDPNAATMSQKVVQYQAALQLAQQAPQLYNMALLHRQMLDVLGIKDAKKLVPIEDDMKSKDPITENMALINMKPVKAFIWQDHEAHIQVHTNAMKDPKIAQLIGQNPQAQAISAAAMAHINEHLAFAYRQQMEQIIGMPLPTGKEDEEIPRDAEAQIAALAAQASNVLLNRNQTEIAAQQAQQAAQDPVVQMQQQELQLKAQEVERKKQKDLMDAAAKADQLQVEQERIASQEKIAGMSVGAKAAKDKAEQELDKLRIGVEVGKSMAESHKQSNQPSKKEDK
jgi:hypothetical protein